MSPERSERRRRARAGVSMVELVISTVVIAVGLAGVLMVIDTTTRHSADPMLQQQAVAVAEAYLEEVLLQSYLDPDGGICPAAEASRSLYDNVCDYAGLDDSPPRDQSGVAVPDLAAYRVRIAVDQAANLAGFVGSALVLRVDVRVTHPAGLDLSISGYRTNY